MDIEKFIKLRKFLYHLTDERNISSIFGQQKLLSATAIVAQSAIEDKPQFLSTRRGNHCAILVDGIEYRLRDQQPISMNALEKCVSDGWSAGNFIKHLNDRVFFWPTLHRLGIHYGRYESEQPKIIRVATDSMLQVNPTPRFCRLNSGATRANSWLGGVAPSRGKDTFLTQELYGGIPSSVVEVTFEESCNLPVQLWISGNPAGPWKEIVLPESAR